MAKEYIHKIQADGRDSWTCIETNEQGQVVNKYMVYEDPSKRPESIAITILKNATPEEIAEIKRLLS